MKEKLELLINSEHFYEKDNSDTINYKSKATIYKKRNKYYIIYNDENNNKTNIKIEPGGKKVFIHRLNPQLKQLFEENNKTKGTYNTPYGNFDLEIFTSQLKIKIDEKNGYLKIKYKLYINGKYSSLNYLDISWDIL